MRKRSRLIAALGSVALAGAIASCSAPEGTSAGRTTATSGSGTDSSVSVACSQQEDFCQAITAAFQKETGIKTTYVRLGSGEVLARLATTKGEFDVWAGGQAENHLIANDKGFVEPYVSPGAKSLPAKYNDASGIWSGFYTDSLAFCSNKSELQKKGLSAPASWNDLLNEKLKGAVAMPHPATAGVGYMAMYTGAALNGGEQAKTIDYFKKLNTNVMQYSKSAATGTEQAGRGEVAVAIALDSDCQKAIGAGYPDLVTSYAAEGTGYEVGAVSVLKNAKHADAAKKFFDFLLTAKTQNAYAGIPSFAVPTHPDATLGKGVPAQDKVKQVNWDIRKAADARDTYISAFNKEISSSDKAK